MTALKARHPASQAVPILTVAAALGLETSRPKARRFNGPGHARRHHRTPSLAFSPDTGRFRCFGCGVGGDAIDLVRAARGCSFGEAVAWIGRLAGGGPYPTPLSSSPPQQPSPG